MDRLAGMLGLAKKAGRLAAGSAAAIDAIRGGKARIVLIACDASANSKKQLMDKAAFRKVRAEQIHLTTEQLGRALGKARTAAVALTDDGFLAAYEKQKAASDAGTAAQNSRKVVSYGNDQ